MGLEAYYSSLIQELRTAAHETQKLVENSKELIKQRLEEAQLSSSKGKEQKKDCDKHCKFKDLLSKFSPELLAKILEYGLSPNELSPNAAMKKLLVLGMPAEHILLDLEESGKDISRIQGLLAKNGLSGQLNTVLVKGIENQSSSSAIAYAEGLIEAQKSSSKEISSV